MKVVVMALAMTSMAVPASAQAAEGEKALQLRPKAAMVAAVSPVSPVQPNAPFVSPSAAEPELAIFASRQDNAQEATRSSCSEERAVCYDSVSGRVVYKPARKLMPELPGLRPENISIKRNQLVLRYSF
jgi:hypothetical protein